jgi:hypothetical protein
MIRWFFCEVEPIGLGKSFGHRPSSCSRDRAAPVVFLQKSGEVPGTITSEPSLVRITHPRIPMLVAIKAPGREASVPGRHNHCPACLELRLVGGKRQSLWPSPVFRGRTPHETGGSRRTRNVCPRRLRVPGAVKYSGLSRSKLYELLSNGRIRSICVRSQEGAQRGVRLIDRESIDSFMESHAAV